MVIERPFMIEHVCPGEVQTVSPPERKYALLIRGGAARDSQWNLSSTILNLVQNHAYHHIEIIEPCGSPRFEARDFTQRVVYLPRLCERIQELAREVSEEGSLQISYFGPLLYHGSDFIIPSTDGNVRGHDLRAALARIPNVSIHYIGSEGSYNGDFAKSIATVRHPDLGARHLAVSPTIPHAYNPEAPGWHNNQTFLEQFFGRSHHPSLDTHFKASARKNAHHAVSKGMRIAPAYLAYGHVSPNQACL